MADSRRLYVFPRQEGLKVDADLALFESVEREHGPIKPHLKVWFGDSSGSPKLHHTFKPVVEVRLQKLSSDEVELYGKRLMEELKVRTATAGKRWWNEEELAELIEINSQLVRPILDHLNRDGYLQYMLVDPNDRSKRLYRYP